MRYYHILGTKDNNTILRFTGETFHMYMNYQLGWVDAGVMGAGFRNDVIYTLEFFEKWEITEAEFRRLIFMESI